MINIETLALDSLINSFCKPKVKTLSIKYWKEKLAKKNIWKEKFLIDALRPVGKPIALKNRSETEKDLPSDIRFDTNYSCYGTVTGRFSGTDSIK